MCAIRNNCWGETNSHCAVVRIRRLLLTSTRPSEGHDDKQRLSPVLCHLSSCDLGDVSEQSHQVGGTLMPEHQPLAALISSPKLFSAVSGSGNIQHDRAELQLQHCLGLNRSGEDCRSFEGGNRQFFL